MSSWVLLWVLVGLLAALALYSAGFTHGGRRGRRLEAELERWHLRARGAERDSTIGGDYYRLGRPVVLETSLLELYLSARFAAEPLGADGPRRLRLIEWQVIELDIEEVLR